MFIETVALPETNSHFAPENRGFTPGSLEIPNLESTISRGIRGELLVLGSVFEWFYFSHSNMPAMPTCFYIYLDKKEYTR